jgi:hypothetical protein
MIPWAVKLGPAWVRRLIVAAMPLEHVTLLKHFSDILWNTANEVLTSKQDAVSKGDASMAEQIGQGKDIMSILRNCCLPFSVWLNLTKRSAKQPPARLARAAPAG